MRVFWIAATQIVLATLVAPASAQVNKVEGWISVNIVATRPLTPRAYALETFAKLKAYYDARGAGLGDSQSLGDTSVALSYLFDESSALFTVAGGEPDGFTVHLDGTVEYKNMTPEDALLLLVADRVRDSLDNLERWDEQQAAEKEAKKEVPPTYLKARGKRYRVKDVPAWSQNILADTNCQMGRIRTTHRDVHKQNSILHEAMNVATGCSDDRQLHQDIYRISPGLLRILQDNPSLVKFLTEKADPR